MKVVVTQNNTYIKPRDAQKVVVTRDVVKIITKGIQGVQGIPGLDGGSDYSYTAGENIGALKPCYFDSSTGKVRIASNDTLIQSVNFVGVSIESGITDGNIRIKRSGIMVDDFWNFSLIGDTSIFLGNSGNLTQTPPTSGIRLKIGSALQANKIFIDVSEIVILN